jgi:hypothetical protein
VNSLSDSYHPDYLRYKYRENMEQCTDGRLEEYAGLGVQVNQHYLVVETRHLRSPTPPFSEFVLPKERVFSPFKSQTASMDTLRKIQLPNSRADPNNEILYLTGLKGLFAVQSFIWVYLHTFIPTLVSAPSSSLNIPGPAYQVILRKTLSVLFWNENLIY